MMRKGGNPFVANKEGNSVASMAEALDDEDSKGAIQAEIEAFKVSFPPRDQEALVHSAVRQNQLNLVQLYKTLGASFESYNDNRELPLDRALKNGYHEMALLILRTMDNAVEKTDLAKKYPDFFILTPVSQSARKFLGTTEKSD